MKGRRSGQPCRYAGMDPGDPTAQPGVEASRPAAKSARPRKAGSQRAEATVAGYPGLEPGSPLEARRARVAAIEAPTVTTTEAAKAGTGPRETVEAPAKAMEAATKSSAAAKTAAANSKRARSFGRLVAPSIARILAMVLRPSVRCSRVSQKWNNEAPRRIPHSASPVLIR